MSIRAGYLIPPMASTWAPRQGCSLFYSRNWGGHGARPCSPSTPRHDAAPPQRGGRHAATLEDAHLPHRPAHHLSFASVLRPSRATFHSAGRPPSYSHSSALVSLTAVPSPSERGLRTPSWDLAAGRPTTGLAPAQGAWAGTMNAVGDPVARIPHQVPAWRQAGGMYQLDLVSSRTTCPRAPAGASGLPVAGRMLQLAT